MKDLVNRLQNEMGLDKDQARMATGIFRDYLVECDDDPDLIETVKAKASHAAKKVKAKYNEVADKVEDWAEKTEDKFDDMADRAEDTAEDWARKAKRTAKKAADKISDFLDD